MAGFNLGSFFAKPIEGNNVERSVLDSLLSGMPNALIAYDGDFKVTHFNAAAERLFKVPASAVVGHFFLRATPPIRIGRSSRRPFFLPWRRASSRYRPKEPIRKYTTSLSRNRGLNSG